MEHTPTPWETSGDRIKKIGKILASTWIFTQVDETRSAGESWIDMRSRTEDARNSALKEPQDNAEFIVTACNAYDKLVADRAVLVEALKRIAIDENLDEAGSVIVACKALAAVGES